VSLLSRHRFDTSVVAVRVRIVPPAEDARIRDVGREEIAEPVDVVRRRPRLVAMSIQSVDGDNANSC
jgi:hypothetical protein